MNAHIKAMSEIFEALATIGNAVSEEDRVVHLLANLPDSCNVLVTALEAQSENVPRWELITERLLHQEIKFKERISALRERDRKALITHLKKRKTYILVIFVISRVTLRKIAEST